MKSITKSPFVWLCIIFIGGTFLEIISRFNNFTTSSSFSQTFFSINDSYNNRFYPRKKVLIYAATTFFHKTITDESFLDGCTSTKGFCHITSDSNDLEKADVIVFHNADYSSDRLPPIRYNVPYVLYSMESPYNDKFRPGQDIINWTMSYRRDADVWYPYGHFEPLETEIDYDLDSIWYAKDPYKSVAWLASNCHTGNNRIVLIKELIKLGMKADLYGRCGKPAPKCQGVSKQSDHCVIQLLKPYKFYLAFENTNCRDYVSEKFFESLRTRMVVPIVMERKIYEDIGAPPSSFIAISDFETLNDFTNHLIDLELDKKKYLKYHEWRRSYRVQPVQHDRTGFCELCRRLQKPIFHHKSYKNISKWNEEKICNQSFILKYV